MKNMKKVIALLSLCAALLGCGENVPASAESGNATSRKDGVELLYFHGKQRCVTCLAIEKSAKEVLDAEFADEIRRGELVFKSLDINENETLSEKYEIAWSSLVLVDYADGNESAENLTEFAFINVRAAPEKFKSVLKTKIENLLSN